MGRGIPKDGAWGRAKEAGNFDGGRGGRRAPLSCPYLEHGVGVIGCGGEGRGPPSSLNLQVDFLQTFPLFKLGHTLFFLYFRLLVI